MNTRTKVRGTVAAVALAATVLTPAVAQAKPAGNVADGTCTGAATTKIKVAPQNGSLAVEFEVDANRRGQQWQVRIFHGNVQVMNKVMTTKGLSGSFTVRSVQPNRAGNDSFRGRATRLGDGQNCVGRMSA